MSGTLNVTRPENPRRVLMVAANPGVSPTTGWPVGFWWAELTHPWFAFTEAGYAVDIRSVDGGALQADGFSDPEDASGYAASDILSLGFKRSAQHVALIEDTASIDDVDPMDYDAVFFVGGQSPMVTWRGNDRVQALVRAFYEAGRVTALVCHATCALLETRLSNGELLVSGRTWTGFADAEEKFADDYVGQRIQPFWIESEARAIETTNFVIGPAFAPFAVRDGRLVTGQQQFSGAEAARLVIEAVGR